MKKSSLNGIRTFISPIRNELIEFAIAEKKILIAVNAEKILRGSPQLRAISEEHIGYPDGVGAVLALRGKGFQEATKIPGCELWLDIVRKYHKTKTFYLIGAEQEIVERTVKKLESEFEEIQILGFRNGYISNSNARSLLISDVESTRPDIVFVAMGSPLQEDLMAEMYKRHKAVYQGLGGSFDVFTGKRSRAPQWWVRNNFEWAYRLVKEPLRFFRYLKLMRFFILLQLRRF